MTNKLKPLICTSPKDGQQRTFFLELKGDCGNPGGSIECRVNRSDPPNPADDLFYAKFACRGDDQIQPIALANNGWEYYRGKGITEALFAEVVATTGRELVSSPGQNQAKADEYRTEAATKVWERLLEAGNAKYDEDTDVYAYIP
jgi:hypothetical protein